jgi:hypothetical protein
MMKALLPNPRAYRAGLGSEEVIVTHVGVCRPVTMHTPVNPGALPAPVPPAATAAIGDAANEEADQP